MSVRDNYTMINIREYLALGTDEFDSTAWQELC